MAITNLSNQHISASFQYLAQISSSGNIYDGFGNQINSLNLVTSSYVTAQTASFVNPLRQDVRITGSLFVSSSAATIGQLVTNQNGFAEFSVRNTSTGISASGDIVVYADNGTVSNNYIDMGIHNSGMTSSYSYFGTDFGNALDGYLYNVGGNLRIGNATSAAPFSQSFFLFSNPTATPNITITGSQVGINKTGTLNAAFDVNGNTIISGSLIQAAIALPATLTTGSSEFDGSTFYLTTDTNGRSLNANHHFFYQPTAIVHTVAANTTEAVFSGSLNAFTLRPNSVYEVQYNLFYTKTTAGIITWIINGGAQTWQNAHIHMELSTIAGTGVVTGSNNPTVGGAPVYTTLLNATNRQSVTLASSATSEPNATAHKVIIKALIITNATTESTLKLEHQYSAGTSTIYAGSYYTIKRLPTTSVGVFTA